MRKLITILFLFLSVKCFSQPTKTNPYLGSPSTVTHVRGWFIVDSGLVKSEISILDADNIQICKLGGVTDICDTIATGGNTASIYVVDASTVLVCDSSGGCDTLTTQFLTIDRGVYSPDQAAFRDIKHNTNGHSFEMINNSLLHFSSDLDLVTTATGNLQQTSSLTSISNLDTLSTGASFSLAYSQSAPQFQLRSAVGATNTQITGSTAALTISQTLGNINILNLTSGSQTDSILSYNISSGKLGYVARGAKNYTPSSSADTNGVEGDITYDASFIYIKTGSGWRKVAISAF